LWAVDVSGNRTVSILAKSIRLRLSPRWRGKVNCMCRTVKLSILQTFIGVVDVLLDGLFHHDHFGFLLNDHDTGIRW
jgi:hypothetical protein